MGSPCCCRTVCVESLYIQVSLVDWFVDWQVGEGECRLDIRRLPRSGPTSHFRGLFADYRGGGGVPPLTGSSLIPHCSFIRVTSVTISFKTIRVSEFKTANLG